MVGLAVGFGVLSCLCKCLYSLNLFRAANILFALFTDYCFDVRLMKNYEMIKEQKSYIFLSLVLGAQYVNRNCSS